MRNVEEREAPSAGETRRSASQPSPAGRRNLSGDREKEARLNAQRNELAAREAAEKRRAEQVREHAKKLERRRKAKWLLIFALLSISCVLIYVISRFLGSFFVVGEIRIEGDSPYTDEQIIAASGISYGDKLYLTDKKAAESSISGELAYICEVSVTTKLPSYVYITVKAEEAVIYTGISGGYYALSATMRVLERSDSPEKFIAAGLVYAELPEVASAVVGLPLALADGTDPVYIGEFVDAIADSELKGRISKIFLDERFNIVLSVDGRFRVKFGSDSDAGVKALAASRVIAEQELPEGGTAVIDVSDPSAVIAVVREELDLSKKND